MNLKTTWEKKSHTPKFQGQFFSQAESLLL